MDNDWRLQAFRTNKKLNRLLGLELRQEIFLLFDEYEAIQKIMIANRLSYNVEKDLLLIKKPYINKESKVRKELISDNDWDTIFIDMAKVFARGSKDPNRKVGAIVTLGNRIKACGYNGFPPGCEEKEDNLFNWNRNNFEKDPLNTKYPFVSHAERNALDFVDCTVKGGTLYTTLFPCHECATTIINKGISRIVYLNDVYSNTWQVIASRAKLKEAGILFYKLGYKPVGTYLQKVIKNANLILDKYKFPSQFNIMNGSTVIFITEIAGSIYLKESMSLHSLNIFTTNGTQIEATEIKLNIKKEIVNKLNQIDPDINFVFSCR